MLSKMKSLLIVDDEQALVEIISEIAEEYFDTIHVAYNGAQALELLKEHKFSIILSDISMPEMTGDVFLKKIRLLGFTTPIVFLTGNSSKDLAIEALKLGAADFLEKPFDTEHLIQTLHLAVEVEEHKRNIIELELTHPNKPDFVRSEKKLLGIKHAARTMNNKKSG